MQLPSENSERVPERARQNAPPQIGRSRAVPALHLLRVDSPASPLPPLQNNHLEPESEQLAGGREASQAGADDYDIGLGGVARNSLFDGGGDAEVDVAVGEEELVGGAEEGVAVGGDGGEEGVDGEPIGGVLTPAGEDVVADEDVVDLLDAAGGGDDGGLELLVGEGVGGEAGGEGGEGLGGGFSVEDDDLFGDVRGRARARARVRVWIRVRVRVWDGVRVRIWEERREEEGVVEVFEGGGGGFATGADAALSLGGRDERVVRVRVWLGE